MSQHPCLPVRKRRKTEDGSKPVDFDDIENMDGTEYLGRVVQEANRLPEVFVAQKENETLSSRRNETSIQGSAASLSYLISDRTLVKPAPTAEHLPADPSHWVDLTLANFSSLREYLERCKAHGVGGKDTNRLPLPTMKDRPGWHIFCVGPDDARGNEGSYFDDDDDKMDNDRGSDDAKEQDRPIWMQNMPTKGYSPTVSLLLQMDQVMIRRVLSHLVYFVREGWTASNAQRAAWIYALLARLERPIHRDDASMLYGLLKALTQQRAEIMMGSADTAARQNLAFLNVLIAVVGIYFEQGGGFAAVMTTTQEN